MIPRGIGTHFGGGEPGDHLPAGPWTRLAEPFELTLLDQMLLRDLYHYAGDGRDWALAVTLAALLRSTRAGHLCLELAAASPPTEKARLRTVHLFSRLAEFMAGVREDRYGQLVAYRDARAYRPLVWVERSGGPLLYFHKYHFHAHRLQARLLEYLAAAPPSPPSAPPLADLLEDLYSDEHTLRVGPSGRPIARDRGQLEALAMALAHSFALISGGPGTGKTSLMVNLLRALVRQGIDPHAVVLGAPTGRAAQRMTEALENLLNSIARPAFEDEALRGLTAQTLHAILHYRHRNREFSFNRHRPLPAQVVVLDESSMVDVVLMDQFVQALDPRSTRLVMLGDKDQLPAVEAGAVFAEMIPGDAGGGAFRGHLASLTTVFRSGHRLATLARGVNQGTWPAPPPISIEEALRLDEDQWGWVEAQPLDQWHRTLARWTHHWYGGSPGPWRRSYPELLAETRRCSTVELLTTPKGRQLLGGLFGIVEAVRVLTLMRKGPFGCDGVNLLMALHLAKILGRRIREDLRPLFGGVPVLIRRNDPPRSLYNGDVGICLEDRDGLRQIYFRRGGEFTAWPDTLLVDFELAFALTVHKSQGSEYGRVLLVLPDDPAQGLLSREILYTGITRARQALVVYGPRDCLEAALARRIQRISGLQW